MSSLRCIERRFQRNPESAAVYDQGILKLEKSGYISEGIIVSPSQSRGA